MNTKKALHLILWICLAQTAFWIILISIRNGYSPQFAGLARTQQIVNQSPVNHYTKKSMAVCSDIGCKLTPSLIIFVKSIAIFKLKNTLYK